MVKKFKEMKSGNTYQIYALLTDITEREARNGSKFLILTLSDGTEEIAAKLFDYDIDGFKIEPKTVIKVEIEVSMYNSSVSYIIRRFRETTNHGLDIVIDSADIRKEVTEFIQDVEKKKETEEE
ncbi:MAG: hypothetical protein LIO53_09110 [Oscillospiraceae bacterium]|nr:hypothetical protein [Oscillospiraceae bacterium]